MAWNVVSQKLVKSTIKLATEISEMEGTPHERLLSEHRLSWIKRWVDANEMRDFTWAVCDCKANGKRFRVNGHHTSLVLASTAEEKHPLVNLVTIQADTMVDVAKVFSAFDAPESVRPWRQVLWEFASRTPSLLKLHRKTVAVGANGLQWYLWQGAPAPTEKNEKGVAFRLSSAEKAIQLTDPKFTQFYTWIDSYVNGEDGLHLQRGPVTGAMAKSWYKDKQAAETFWPLIRDGGDARQLSPVRQLRDFLLCSATIGHSATGGSRRGMKGGLVTGREMHVRCILAWNMYRGKKTGRILYRQAGDIPDVE